MNLKYICSARGSHEPLQTPVVFVVDSDASVRDALDSLIRSAGWQPITATSAEEFLTFPRIMTPGCLVTELQLPGWSGLDLQRRVSERTELPIIFMSTRPDFRAAVQAMKAGALEFLTKPLMEEVTREAIRVAIERSRAALRHVAQTRALQERYELLSRREREVMSLLVNGCLNKQVGGELGISEITVKAHRGRMMRKMKASSFAELVTMAGSLRRDISVTTAEFDAIVAESSEGMLQHRAIA
jgi:FixJ family two-component response regulator